ncbi:MAG: hypothetical protein EA412_14460 [Chitinophagaceae bacterium]|nr:MAG: hypothetical protein EA412_14460 [Chitinophagaceae bacterium]
MSTGRVSYTVTRQSRWMPFYSRFRPPFGRETEITSGYTTLENGKFIISFPAIPDYAAGKHKGQLFHYEVKADVTDESGETHSGLQTVVLGRQPFSIETNLPQKINASRFEGFFIQSNNLQGNPVNTSGELIVRKLVPHKKPFKKRPWADPTQLMIDEQIYQRLPYWESPYEDYTPKTGEIVLRQNLQIEGKIELDKSLLQQLSENTYRIEIRLAGEKGDSVKVEQDFVLFKEDTRNMPEPDFLWTHQLKSQLSKGEKPQLLMGSSVNAKIRLQAATSNGMITDEWVSLNNRKRLYTFNPGNNYTGRVTVKLSMIFENMVFEESFSYFIAPPPEYLQAEWIQKPDTLAPGSANLWELTLKNEKGEPADAEFMAVLYDASLDQLTPHKWQTSWNKRFPSVSINFRNAQSFGLENTRIRDSRHRRWSIVEPQKGDLNMFGFQTFGWYQIYMKGASMRGGRAAETYDLQEESLELSEVAVLNFQTPLIDADSDVVEKTSEIDDPAHEEEPTAIREDFAETAFFYPVLKTDENGKVQMEFDMPETLTRWKFMGLGHTQELRTLIIEHTAITHQNWMVKSFLPRWVREGDEITLTATAYNMSQQEQNGNLQIIIKDALTQKDVTFAYLQDEKNKQITIAPNNSKVVNWKVAIPGEHAFLEIEISGTAAGESDGERHLLPVLPLYVPVTESFNFYVDEKGQHHFQIPFAAKMQDEKVRPELFRLEFTPNPSWQVIFALPNLLEVQHRTADNLASQYFAISLGQHIFKQHPEIAVVLKALQQQQHSGDRNILEGFLAQHPEFKALTLQATPWVRQSIAESENLQSLLQLTDQNYVNNRKREIVRQLQNYQTSEGGFSWMPQGRPNQYITRVVVELFAKLQSQQIETTEPGLTEMLNSARNYLQQETNRQWAEFKKHEKYDERHTPVYLLNNLYALSFFSVNTSDNTTAHEILEHAKKHQSDFAPQLQALVGMTAFRYNKKEIATESIEILKAQAIRSKDRGTYWRTSAHSWRWQDAPIETHAAIVQAFLEIAPQEERLVLEVQKWLLLNKQVSAWPTTRGTTEVIWAMLKSPADMLKTEKDIRLQYGDVDWTFSGREAEPGTLYRSQTYSNTQIRSLPDKITVDAGEDGLSWGSVMYRYDTPIDHIEDYGDELKVEKAFFVQYREDGKTLSRPLAEHGNLQQGDLLISRLTLRADRDMDFLHLKDVRPPVAEPVESISGRQFSHGLSYYIAIGDEGVNLYFDRFRAGTYIIEIPVRIVHKGNVAGGNASFQSFYAPSFSAGSGGGRVRVE